MGCKRAEKMGLNERCEIQKMKRGQRRQTWMRGGIKGTLLESLKGGGSRRKRN